MKMCFIQYNVFINVIKYFKNTIEHSTFIFIKVWEEITYNHAPNVNFIPVLMRVTHLGLFTIKIKFI